MGPLLPFLGAASLWFDSGSSFHVTEKLSVSVVGGKVKPWLRGCVMPSDYKKVDVANDHGGG